MALIDKHKLPPPLDPHPRPQWGYRGHGIGVVTVNHSGHATNILLAEKLKKHTNLKILFLKKTEVLLKRTVDFNLIS